ncbi:unnamed protein product [Schistocephalus solidus]|uniref:Uncharacterized protein n=1 Tax=Schistocephalus solidus TaxID=70667 RepID=A0A183TS14_SCHSO|nr:unnamed protein product [Schistocephalus solidus]
MCSLPPSLVGILSAITHFFICALKRGLKGFVAFFACYHSSITEEQSDVGFETLSEQGRSPTIMTTMEQGEAEVETELKRVEQQQQKQQQQQQQQQQQKSKFKITSSGTTTLAYGKQRVRKWISSNWLLLPGSDWLL